jgi:hypothetical protein
LLHISLKHFAILCVSKSVFFRNSDQKRNRVGLWALLMLLVTCCVAQEVPSWKVPIAGNAFITESSKGSRDGFGGAGLQWQQADSVVSVYFHVDRACELSLGLLAKVEGKSEIQATVGQKKWKVLLEGAAAEHSLGKLSLRQAGYVRLDMQGLSKTAGIFAQVSDVVVRSSTAGVKLSCVKTNEGNMFYWGKRGPSVHLGYDMPRDETIRYAYSEITVPKGQDPIGSYFMANGFGEGYFGIQVKSPTERWILFSVWSPFQTDNPRDIPEDHKILTLAQGEGVRVGAFGGEGSGGQSICVFPWKAGTTYKFLNSVQPDGKGHTIYSAWFGEVGKKEWKLIARFQRPKTDKNLTGFHSFLENFDASRGYYGRSSMHGNQWVCDTEGQWHEITRARFTGDGTAGGGHRLDYAGGLVKDGFFMRNGGFFSDRVALNQVFTRPSTAAKKPVIDFAKLP